jgi:hypothetical protein
MAPYGLKLLYSKWTADPPLPSLVLGSNRISTYVENNSQSSVFLEINRIYHVVATP